MRRLSRPERSTRQDRNLQGDGGVETTVALRLDDRLDRHSSAPVAVALSGGSDSTALLALTCDWARCAGRRVIAFTVDHGLNPDSAAWTGRAGEAAHRLGAGWRALSWAGDKPSAGLQAAARLARHRLIAGAAREAGAAVVLFGHTADDVAEAGLMAASGSSVRPPGPWTPSPVWPEGRSLFLFRPLLDISRVALRGWLALRGLDWFEDPANADARFARARARMTLAQQHRELRDAEPSLADPDHGVILQLARETRTGTGGEIEIESAVLGTGGPECARLLARAVVSAGGGARLPDLVQLQRLIARLGQGDLDATLAGARLQARNGRLLIARDSGEIRRKGLAAVRAAQGARVVWDGRFELTPPGDGQVLALEGHAATLAPPDRARLKALPRLVRPALPIFRLDGALSPIAAFSLPWTRSLVPARFAGACGLITHEREITGLSRGEGAGAFLC